MQGSVTALVVPIFRRYWLWTAKATADALAPTHLASAEAARGWSDGRTLEERFSLLGQRIISGAQTRLMREWRKLEDAREGTLRNRAYRLAQGILAREDPQESFLKSIPSVPSSITGGENVTMMVTYPSAYHERLIRRRLRLMVGHGHHRHRRRLVWWSLALIPQMPLMLTPLPNITVYYTIYRIYSHYRALQGSKALGRGFEALDAAQLEYLRGQLLRIREECGPDFAPADSWAARLVKKESRYLDIFERLRTMRKQRRLEQAAGPEQQFEHIHSEHVDMQAAPHKRSGLFEPGKVSASTGLLLVFLRSSTLDELTEPTMRYQSPLSDDAALRVGQAFEWPNLLESVARARRRCLGSMFPAHTELWGKG